MPTFNILRETKINESFRNTQIRGMFTFEDKIVSHNWKFEIPDLSSEWKIGLIVGSSGSGKTTLSKEIFKNYYFHENWEWDNSVSVIDNFEKKIETKDIVQIFNAVGFSSPPHWLKPYNHLSNGQKFRVDLARCFLSNYNEIIFDEFTSVVDRDVAKIGCVATAKAIRKFLNKKFVAVSCHYDIIDWLDPDWIFDVNAQKFEWRERRRFPEIKLDIYKTTPETWKFFREYHYLNHEIHHGAQCYVGLLNNKFVAFSSVIHFPHPSSAILKREHRTVVVPDFQGIGIGNRISEYVAEIYINNGWRFISTTSSPSMIYHRNNSPLWIVRRFGRSPHTKSKHHSRSSSAKRITVGFEYIGKK